MKSRERTALQMWQDFFSSRYEVGFRSPQRLPREGVGVIYTVHRSIDSLFKL
ncbi:hypothetical protein JG687_00009425 [Phytophthora cactorum]|uniref:Uncharacterized protein n=1 Tax=Phytophthora cactorum TaxID=29920 RepID=A0A8T1UC68_9STRA|nr:hypothetical protein JG687_00009425 [Phytophthora cactorum]